MRLIKSREEGPESMAAGLEELEHAGDDAENGGGGAEAFRIEDHRAAENNLKRKGVERREEKGVVQAGRELLGAGVIGDGGAVQDRNV